MGLEGGVGGGFPLEITGAREVEGECDGDRGARVEWGTSTTLLQRWVWVSLGFQLAPHTELSGPEIPDASRSDELTLDQRMRFLAPYLRRYQDSERLMRSPFTEAQIAELAAGRIPKSGG